METDARSLVFNAALVTSEERDGEVAFAIVDRVQASKNVDQSVRVGFRGVGVC